MRRFIRISCGLLKDFQRTQTIKNRLVFKRPMHAKENIFHQLNYNQQKRGYAPEGLNNKEIKCWNCEREYSNIGHFMLCQHCGLLQDVKNDINYFELFDFPQKFDFDSQSLTERFRRLQTVVHPDKYSNKSSREQSNSADWSSLVNKAYKTLSTPLERGQYLLEMRGYKMPEDNSVLDKGFLIEMMERNEEVEDALSGNELNSINERIAQEMKEKLDCLEKSFAENNLGRAKKLLIEMKYLKSIQATIKTKLEVILAT